MCENAPAWGIREGEAPWTVLCDPHVGPHLRTLMKDGRAPALTFALVTDDVLRKTLKCSFPDVGAQVSMKAEGSVGGAQTIEKKPGMGVSHSVEVR